MPLAAGASLGAAGNANALSSYRPEQNSKRFRPITYGSSHIQAISFLNKGKVDARTILTYSQYENPTSRWHQDQTKLFAKKRWVKFPFTAREIKRAQLRSFTLKGR